MSGAAERPVRDGIDSAGAEGRAAGPAAGSANSTGAPSEGEPVGQRGRRSERSSDSTTIAGLLAEALVAYQETTEEPAQPAAEPENDFGRLFDWRYQAPDSGRHRSAE